jgi:Xaa-Pro aminopeptidase
MRGLLLFGDTERSAALRHEIPVAIIDPLLFAEVDGRRYVLTSALEQARVKRALPDAAVAGHATQRTARSDEDVDGFRFSLGHGVGLEPHEAPLLGLAGHEPLVAGDVLAIEPGLWDRRIGGVIFEDLVLVTETGCELLTRFPYDLAPRA